MPPSVRAGFALLVALTGVTAFAADPAPERLLLQPASLDLVGRIEPQRVLVTAVAAGGRLTDVTRAATFTAPADGPVAVAADGTCSARADGVGAVRVRYAGTAAVLPVRVRGVDRVVPPSFVNDVLPVLTRQGCNSGSCHGKGAGQNGFRLSLRGYAPESDYPWITRDFHGRRIDTAVPANSLLLLKPTGLAPHEGGKLFGVGSREYRVLLGWLESGRPGPVADDPAVWRLELLPGDRTLRPGQEQQLLVRAEHNDGSVRDVTWLSKFDSNDAGVVGVTADGLARALRPGATSVRAMFQGQVAVVTLTIPFDRPVPAERFAARNNFIDELVFPKLAGLNIEPSGLCTDAEFIRRLFLDAMGTLPTPDEVRQFLADPSPGKRARLIDAVLARPGFVDYWTQQLADLLQNRKERDHDVRGTKGVRAFHEWIREQVAANRPWDEVARAVLTATGPADVNPAVGYFVVTVGEHREVQKSEVVDSVAQAFLGTRIGCARCHNHPLERYTQDDYYRFAGFFARVKLQRNEPLKGTTTLVVSAQDPRENLKPVGVTQPRTGRFLAPRPLDRSEVKFEPGEDPRQKLAAWVTDPKNEYFAGAMVNRLWRHYLGVGLVEPVDDLRASNPPTNPELWSALVKEFVGHRYDLKYLMRLILNSRTYQLSAETTPGNAADGRFYSHYHARRLPAEVLLDAISQATGVPDTFPGYPVGVRATQLPDPGLKSYFLSLFGRSERVTACACERGGEVTMPQLLHLMNGDVLAKVRSADGRLAALLKATADDRAVVEELFLATLSRPPGAAEWAAVRKELAAGDGREEVFRDLFWALLNAKDFSFNR
jgi:hypothetical protein